ncbi:hypothetical protein [uncultured Croceitalea sp.]
MKTTKKTSPKKKQQPQRLSMLTAKRKPLRTSFVWWGWKTA